MKRDEKISQNGESLSKLINTKYFNITGRIFEIQKYNPVNSITIRIQVFDKIQFC